MLLKKSIKTQISLCPEVETLKEDYFYVDSSANGDTKLKESALSKIGTFYSESHSDPL